MDISMKGIKEILLSKNIKPSHHRIRIFEYLMENKIHPTVEQIYSGLIDEIPTLSKTTVYNTLNLLVEADLVRVLNIDDIESRYDISTENHGHFKCEDCSKIFDFPINDVKLDTAKLSDFQVNKKNVYFVGICPRCLKNNKNHQEVING